MPQEELLHYCQELIEASRAIIAASTASIIEGRKHAWRSVQAVERLKIARGRERVRRRIPPDDDGRGSKRRGGGLSSCDGGN